MKIGQWYLRLSKQQRLWMLGTLVTIVGILFFGILMNSGKNGDLSAGIGLEMSIKDIAPKLGVTPKSLAQEFKLSRNISKRKPLYSIGITDKELQQVIRHLRSHQGSTIKYYVVFVLVLWGWIFLVKLGRPLEMSVNKRKIWYPRTPYVIPLLLAVIVAGFILGKSPNPMEAIVKSFKSMAGFYPDPYVTIIALIFFLILAIIGNKLICGWACPFGALQELIYSIPILKKIKRRKLPFVLTNSIRASIFVIMLLLLYGNMRGATIYHYINPFNLFDWRFETASITFTVVVVLAASFIMYRPFCQFVCPFGLVSWIVEPFSIFRVVIDRDKCIQGNVCINACPLETTKGMLEGKKITADCYSCMRCLNVCPVEAITYAFFLKNVNRKKFEDRRSGNLRKAYS
jgi:ferredoxin